MFVGRLLADKRREIGLTQQQIADKLGIPRTTYASYEQNKNGVDMNMTYKLATLFKISHEIVIKSAEDMVRRDIELHEDDSKYFPTGDMASLQGKYIALLERENARLGAEATALQATAAAKMHAWQERIAAYETRVDALREFVLIHLSSYCKLSTQEAAAALGIIENRLIGEKIARQNTPAGAGTDDMKKG